MKIMAIKDFFEDLRPRRIHNLIYWLKCKLWYKYNVLKIRTLPPTWNDRDNVLVHAMFQILHDFVHKEKIDEHVDWDSDTKHREARDKMDEILNWWENTYLIFDEHEGLEFDWQKKPYDDMWVKCEDSDSYELKPSTEHDNELYKIVWAREKQMRKDLNKKLKELIDIKDYLWT